MAGFAGDSLEHAAGHPLSLLALPLVGLAAGLAALDVLLWRVRQVFAYTMYAFFGGSR